MSNVKVATNPTIKDIFSKMVVGTPGENQGGRLKEINKALRKIEDADVDSFFGFERVQIDNEDATLELERERLRIKMARRGFKELDPTFLSWRKKTDKLPAYMIVEIDTDSGQFRITVSPDGFSKGEYDWEIDPDLPELLKDQFHDANDYLYDLAKKKNWEEISITANLKGFMGDHDLRKKIERVQGSDLFDEIHLIAEAPAWKINETKYLEDDPIVVGWVDKTSQMFVIGSFDLTPLEEHVLINHTR